MIIRGPWSCLRSALGDSSGRSWFSLCICEFLLTFVRLRKLGEYLHIIVNFQEERSGHNWKGLCKDPTDSGNIEGEVFQFTDVLRSMADVQSRPNGTTDRSRNLDPIQGIGSWRRTNRSGPVTESVGICRLTIGLGERVQAAKVTCRKKGFVLQLPLDPFPSSASLSFSPSTGSLSFHPLVLEVFYLPWLSRAVRNLCVHRVKGVFAQSSPPNDPLYLLTPRFRRERMGDPSPAVRRGLEWTFSSLSLSFCGTVLRWVDLRSL